jgi:hypothetical protein
MNSIPSDHQLRQFFHAVHQDVGRMFREGLGLKPQLTPQAVTRVAAVCTSTPLSPTMMVSAIGSAFGDQGFDNDSPVENCCR